MTILKTVFKSLGIPDERVRLKWISASEGRAFAETVTMMVDELKALGPSPFKKMWQI